MPKYTLLKNKETGERRVRINKTGEYISELTDPDKYNDLRKKALRNLGASQHDENMRSLGLAKVKGAVSGKTYWE